MFNKYDDDPCIFGTNKRQSSKPFCEPNYRNLFVLSSSLVFNLDWRVNVGYNIMLMGVIIWDSRHV